MFTCAVSVLLHFQHVTAIKTVASKAFTDAHVETSLHFFEQHTIICNLPWLIVALLLGFRRELTVLQASVKIDASKSN